MFLICSKWNNVWLLTLERVVRVASPIIGDIVLFRENTWGLGSDCKSPETPVCPRSMTTKGFSLPSCKGSGLKLQPIQMGPEPSRKCLQTLFKHQGFCKPIYRSYFSSHFLKRWYLVIMTQASPEHQSSYQNCEPPCPASHAFYISLTFFFFLRQIFLDTPGWSSIHSSPPASTSWVLYSQASCYIPKYIKNLITSWNIDRI